MTDRGPIGSTSLRDREPGKKKGLWWLWLLLALAVIALIALLVARNAGDDDPEGVGVSGQDCPDYAGAEGKDETTEIADDPSPFFGCEVAVAAPVVRMLGEDAAELEGGIVIVRGDGVDTWDVSEGAVVGVTGEMNEELESDEADLESVQGQPYIDVDEAGPPTEE